MAETKVKTTITMEQTDLEQAALEWARSRRFVSVDDLAFARISVSKKTRGYGMSEEDYHAVECVITADRKVSP